MVNVDTEDNTVKVPAGSDYTVTCSSSGFPPPEIRWVDSEGNASGAVLCWLLTGSLENR